MNYSPVPYDKHLKQTIVYKGMGTKWEFPQNYMIYDAATSTVSVVSAAGAGVESEAGGESTGAGDDSEVGEDSAAGEDSGAGEDSEAGDDSAAGDETEAEAEEST
jgi:hypothetical protein